MNIVRHLIGWRKQAHTTETTEEKKEKTDEGTEEKKEKSDGVLFNHIPWNNVDIQQHFDAVTMNKEESENLLSDQNFSDDGTQEKKVADLGTLVVFYLFFPLFIYW